MTDIDESRKAATVSDIYVSAEKTIAAPADRIYTCLADHERHHPRFLPPAFSAYTVEEGGVGAGTVVSYRLKAGLTNRGYRARIDEPEPGRVIREMVEDTGAVTTFTVTPDAAGTRVRIESRIPARAGLQGWIERLFTCRILRPLFEDELNLLDTYARAEAHR